MKRWVVLGETVDAEDKLTGPEVSEEFDTFDAACRHGQRNAREYPHTNFAVYEKSSDIKVEAAVVPAPDHPEWKGDCA